MTSGIPPSSDSSPAAAETQRAVVASAASTPASAASMPTLASLPLQLQLGLAVSEPVPSLSAPLSGAATAGGSNSGGVVPLSWPAAPATGSGGAAAAGAGAMPPNELRTIFLAGFPADVKLRELHNLLKFLPGYEACQLHATAPTPTGFALFASHAAALDAIRRLNGEEFDEATHIRAEAARKNLFLKPNDPSIRFCIRPRPAEAIPSTNPAGLLPGLMAPGEAALWPQAAPVAAHFGGGGDGVGAAGAAPARALLAALPDAALLAAADAASQQGRSSQGSGAAWTSLGFAPVTNLNDNAPCNTLFIGNLCNEIDEADLRAVFEPQPGFRQLQLNASGQVCFVEFADVPSAAYVHAALQGIQVPSNGRGGLRIQFSRNPFGQRRTPAEAATTPGGQPGAGGSGFSGVGGVGGAAGPAAAWMMSNHLLSVANALPATAAMISSMLAGPVPQHAAGGLFGEGDHMAAAAAAAAAGSGMMMMGSGGGLAPLAQQPPQHQQPAAANAAPLADITESMAAASLFGHPPGSFGGF